LKRGAGKGRTTVGLIMWK